MKKYLLFSTLTSITLLSFGQADVWLPIETTGFGSTQIVNIGVFQIFNGNIYCATERNGTGTAQIRYSSTGNTGTWNPISSFTPSLHLSVKAFPAFGKLDSAGIMWVGTGSGIGTRIYRTTDGITFTAISRRGFNNNAGLVTPSPNMLVFQGSTDTVPYLYAGAGSHGGNTNAEVWRIPYYSADSSDWVRIIDFDTIIPPIIPADTVDLISYWCVWNNKIYFSTNCKGQLWESTDGINFTQNALAPFGQYGFGVGSNIVIACLQVFNDTLYASTTNKTLGGQMYRTGDGINWQQITANAFLKADTVEELHHMDTAFGYIWVTAYTDTSISNGCPIWRSSDGINFIQSNTDGFGNPLIDGQNPGIISFGNNMYFGGPNYSTGGQIWRTDITTGIGELLNEDCGVMLFPNPFTDYATIGFDSDCDAVSIFSIYNITGQIVLSVENPSGNQISIEKNNMTAGMYFYNIQTTNGTITTGKFIIQ